MPVKARSKSSVCGRSRAGFNTRWGHGYLSLREYYVLSGTDLFVGPITRTEESYEV